MTRHRCTSCRNPIRGVGVVGPGPGQDEAESWFHPDCWLEARKSAQENYESQVRSSGLEALLAPYVTQAFTQVGAGRGGPTGIAV